MCLLKYSMNPTKFKKVEAGIQNALWMHESNQNDQSVMVDPVYYYSDLDNLDSILEYKLHHHPDRPLVWDKWLEIKWYIQGGSFRIVFFENMTVLELLDILNIKYLVFKVPYNFVIVTVSKNSIRNKTPKERKYD